jgi:hypothetical protein
LNINIICFQKKDTIMDYFARNDSKLIGSQREPFPFNRKFRPIFDSARENELH